MTKERQALGKEGERLALKRLKKLGYKAVETNYRCPLGEIDIIAKDGNTLVFIEIKTRRERSIAQAKEAVNARKQRQLSKVALMYMKSRASLETKARFDVVAVHLGTGTPEIEVIRDAFELAY